MVSDKMLYLLKSRVLLQPEIVNVAEDDFMPLRKVAINSNNSRTSFHVSKDLWPDLAPTGDPRSDTL